MLLSSFAKADGELEIAHIMRPKTDILAKIEAILAAKESVDVITYHHDTTPSSFLFMEALRFAALKGVKVRYLYDELASSRGVPVYSDSYLAVLKAAGVEVRTIDIPARITKWGPFNMIHSKVILTDAGDGQHSMAIMGGRNFGDRYVNWMDNSFALRMRSDSAIHQEMKAYVDRITSSAATRIRKYSGKPIENMAIDEAELRRDMQAYFGTETSSLEVRDFVKFIKGEATGTIPKFRLNASEVRFVSSGLVDKVGGSKKIDTLDEALRDLVKNSKFVEVSTILAAMTDEKMKLFSDFLIKGGTLNILSNGETTFPTVFEGKESVLTTTLMKMQEQDFMKLSESGYISAYKLKKGDFTFHHGKHVVGSAGVLLTSSNFNYSSDVHAEENGLYITSKVFAGYMRRYTNNLKRDFFEEHDYEHGKSLNMVEKSCSLILRSVF